MYLGRLKIKTADDWNDLVAQLQQKASENDDIRHAVSSTSASHIEAFDKFRKTLQIGGVALPLVVGAFAAHGAKAKRPDERLTKERATELVRKYLSTSSPIANASEKYRVPNSNIFVKELNPDDTLNAYYEKLKHSRTGELGHKITYHPKASASVLAHEIGHAQDSFPRAPQILSYLSSPLLVGGAVNTGYDLATGQTDDLGPHMLTGGLGLALQLPTMIDEYGASHRARKILKNEGIKPRGLNRAWLTYALPSVIAAGAGGAGYLLGKNYYDQLHSYVD